MNLSINKEQVLRSCLLVLGFLEKAYVFLFKPKKTALYNGRFMSRLERMEILSEQNKGTVVNGKYSLSLDASYKHTLLIGITGSGKSTTVYVPMIQKCKHSMVILDLSGSLFDMTSADLKKRGFRVKRVNFSDPLNSEGYNPLARADTPSKMKKLSAQIVDTGMGSSGSKDPFWDLSSKQILYTIIRILKESADEKYHNLSSVRYLLNNLSHNPESPGNKWLINNATSEEVYAELMGALGGTEKTIGAVLANTRACLELIADPDLARLVATDTLGDLGKIRQDKPVALFLSVQETDVKYLSFLMSMLL
ncbi:MAG: type IV secretory system conjugative DNA transfer family protein, partial [Bacteroidota bacterium]